METEIVIAIIAGLVSVIVAWIQAKSTAKKQVSDSEVKLESRLTKLETNQASIQKNMFSNEDRKCLYKLEATINWTLTTILTDAVRGLKNPPILDPVLTKLENEIEKKGFTGAFPVLDELTEEQDKALTTYLEKTATSDRSPIKKQRARIVLGLKKLQKDLEEMDAAEPCAE